MAGKFAAAAVMVYLALSLVPGCSQQKQQEIMKEEFFNYTAYFCPEKDCLQVFASQLQGAKSSISCALYRVDNSLLSDLASFYNLTAASTAIEIVVDKNSKVAEKFVRGKSGGGFVLKRSSKGIMHNKYCVIDNATIMTGSFNPAAAAKKDYNNLIIINSTTLAAFYNADFERLKSGNTGKSPAASAVAESKSKRKTTVLNSTAIEVYFCPQDNCMEALKRKLSLANKSIIFAAYSFTHPEIANELILKRSEGIAASGVIEKSTTASEYSKHAMMAASGINVKLESSKRLMHHKFFVIDSRTVMTGSFNPTENADTRNDENMIIIENAAVAGEYVAEFHRIANRT